MTIPKKEASRVIESLPDDSSYEEILRALAFDKMIRNGLKDSKENKTILNEKMKEKIKQW